MVFITIVYVKVYSEVSRRALSHTLIWQDNTQIHPTPNNRTLWGETYVSQSLIDL